MSDGLQEKISQLPRDTGVYLYRNEKGRVIYVGKAKNLKNRVTSYFTKNLRLGTKTHALVSRIVDLEVIQTLSEVEALLLEAELIKRYKPKYNVAHKDDKSHLYIVMRNDTIEQSGKQVKIPKVITARKTDLRKSDVAFGPYQSSGDTRSVLRTLRKAFPYRDCSISKFNKYRKIQKPCLFGHLNLCQAPCLNQADIDEYKKDIRSIKKFLSGDSSKTISNYEKKMTRASKNLDYEAAGYYRDMIKRFDYVSTSFKTAEKYIENPNLLEDLAKEALDEIVESLEIIKSRPKRIECYDISNISGKEAVGSMVVAVDGQINKRLYKRFKVRLKDTPDDYLMMKEVLSRRLKRAKITKEKEESWVKPDLIVLDGGKGQVSIGEKVLTELGFSIPLIGLVKRKETIMYSYEGDYKEIRLPHDNEGLKLLMKLRDEAHRFAQRYHHYLRLKKIRM